MDFVHLEAFCAVAEELHFGRAASRLHLSQPHLSRTISALETDLGAPLFDRTTRRVSLTPAGRAFLEPAARILRTGRHARSDVEAAQRGDSGRVRFSFAGPSSQATVALLARSVRERFPRVDLAVRPGRYGPSAVRELLMGETDLVIARFEQAPSGVMSRALARERVVLAVPSDHPIAARAAASFGELRDEQFITLPESAGSAVRAQFQACCHRAGFIPDIVQTAPDSWTCAALVAAGVGLHVTTVSAMAQMSLDGVVAVAIDDELPPIVSYLLWRSDEVEPALANVLGVSEIVLPTWSEART